MRVYLRGLLTLVLATLSIVTVEWSTAEGVDLGTLPGATAPQANVGTAIDIICPKLRPANSAQQDLKTQCDNMKDPTQLQASIGNSGLLGVMTDVTSEQTSAQGTNAIDARSTQFRTIGARLNALRLGATGVNISGLPLGTSDQTASTIQPLSLRGLGGGASADSDSRLGMFANVVGGFGHTDTTSNEIGFDFHNIGVTAGVDYRFLDSLVAGGAFSYLRTNADFAASLGDADTNSYGFSLYGTYYVGSFYVDLLGGFSYNNYDSARRIVYGTGNLAVDRTAVGDTHGWQYMFNAGTGYDFHFGGTTLTPYMRMEYLHLNVDGYTESGANGLDLSVQSQTIKSLLMVFGGRVGHAFSVPFGILVPQIHAEWRHEFLNNSRSITAQFANDPFNQAFIIPTDNPDRDFAAIGAGISAVLGRGVAAFFEYEAIVGLRNVASNNFTVGVRVQF